MGNIRMFNIRLYIVWFYHKKDVHRMLHFQDLGSDKPFVVQVKTKTAWLWSLKRVIREFGPGRNSIIIFESVQNGFRYRSSQWKIHTVPYK